MHEYNVIGSTKRYIYYYLSVISISLSAIIPVIFNWISSINGIAITIVISASSIFTVLYFLFDRIIWCIPFLKMPNLKGEYDCTGKSYKYNKDEIRDWSGILKITQTWSKTLIVLETESSKSMSISLSASIVRLEGKGYLLRYLYSNEPKPDYFELKTHLGHCHITFNEMTNKGHGIYFTNQDRKSYGSFILTRRKK